MWDLSKGATPAWQRDGHSWGVCLEDHPASEVLEVLWGQEKPRPALVRCLLSTRLGVGPVKGQGAEDPIVVYSLEQKFSQRGGRKGLKSVGIWEEG